MFLILTIKFQLFPLGLHLLFGFERLFFEKEKKSKRLSFNMFALKDCLHFSFCLIFIFISLDKNHMTVDCKGFVNRAFVTRFSFAKFASVKVIIIAKMFRKKMILKLFEENYQSHLAVGRFSSWPIAYCLVFDQVFQFKNYLLHSR